MKAHKVLLFIISCMIGLGTMCLVLPHRVDVCGVTLRWPTLAEVMGNTDRSADRIQNTDLMSPIAEPVETFATVDTVVPEKPKPVIPKVSVDSTTDSRIYLQAFYDALSESGERVVRVLHYGDSQIEEDRMSQQLREHLQKRYGGSGAGLLPLAQTIPTRTMRQELRMSGRTVTPMQGPRRYIVHGFKRDQRTDGRYGVMGQVAELNDDLVSGSEDITAICTPDEQLRYTQWRIFADSSVHYSISGDTVRLSGRGLVYGLSQQSETGVIVDNIPLRGCLGTVFTRINSEQLTTFYREQNVRLVILQFGGNAIPSNKNPGTIQAIVQGLREQVQYIQSCAPEASILFIGPSDMLTQEDGEWHTYPMVPYMDQLLRKMALEEEIGYFSLYRWMGGAGSMLRWQENGLAGADGIHFYRSGARKAGNAVAEWLLEGLNEEMRK